MLNIYRSLALSCLLHTSPARRTPTNSYFGNITTVAVRNVQLLGASQIYPSKSSLAYVESPLIHLSTRTTHPVIYSGRSWLNSDDSLAVTLDEGLLTRLNSININSSDVKRNVKYKRAIEREHNEDHD